MVENPGAEMGPAKIIKSLHDDCSNVVTASCEAKYNSHNAVSYGFANDLDLWIRALSDRPESALFQTASSEFVLALLNNSQGQYRNRGALPLRPTLFVDFHIGGMGCRLGQERSIVDDEKKSPRLPVSH